MKLSKIVSQIFMSLSKAIETILSYDDKNNNYKENYNYKRTR